MAVAALILGICALVLGPIGLGFPFGLIAGILGIIFGAVGRKNGTNKGLATAGLVCSIIGLVASIVFYLACAAFISGAVGSYL